MKRSLYSIDAVNEYVSSLWGKNGVEAIFTVAGCLCDSYVIDHGHAVEVLQECYLNEWSSAYVRHVYRKRVPRVVIDWIKDVASELDPDDYSDVIGLVENFRG